MKKRNDLKRGLIFSLVLILLLGVFAAGCSSGEEKEDAQTGTQAPAAQTGTESAVQEPELPPVTVDTTFFSVEIPGRYEENIRHMEVSEEGVTVNVFYMVHGDTEKELFRIYFGDAAMGDVIGRIAVGDGERSVSVAIASYEQGDFSGEEERQTYYGLMEQLDAVLSAIRSKEGFAAGAAAEAVSTGTQFAKLTYWEVELPATMSWQESKDGKQYRADFYGMVGEERVQLYTIALSDRKAQTFLGTYTVNGEAKPLSVETYSLATQLPWVDDEQTVAYAQMMETINDVLQVIMSSENFSEELPG